MIPRPLWLDRIQRAWSAGRRRFTCVPSCGRSAPEASAPVEGAQARKAARPPPTTPRRWSPSTDASSTAGCPKCSWPSTVLRVLQRVDRQLLRTRHPGALRHPQPARLPRPPSTASASQRRPAQLRSLGQPDEDEPPHDQVLPRRAGSCPRGAPPAPLQRRRLPGNRSAPQVLRLRHRIRRLRTGLAQHPSRRPGRAVGASGPGHASSPPLGRERLLPNPTSCAEAASSSRRASPAPSPATRRWWRALPRPGFSRANDGGARPTSGAAAAAAGAGHTVLWNTPRPIAKIPIAMNASAKSAPTKWGP